MKRFLALLATGALALGLSSNANAQTRGFAAGAIVLDDLQTPQHKVVLTAPVAATPAWNAWQTAGFPTLSWSVPVPPVSGAQSGFIYTGPLTSAPAYPGTMHRLPYWLYPNQASTLPADHSANGGPAGTWDYATSDELGLVSAVGGTLNYVSKFTPNGTTLGNSALFEDATNFQIMSTPGGATPEVTVTLANGNITTLGGLTAGTTGQFTVDGATGNTSTSGTLNNNGNVALAKTAGSTTQIGNVAGFGNVTIGNGGAATGSISLTSGTAGSLNLTGPTNINTTGTAATSIGTNGGNTSIGAAASTNTITGTTGVTGNTSINTSGTGTTSIGNGTNTLTMLGNATLNSSGSGTTTIGNGTVAANLNGNVGINVANASNGTTSINTGSGTGAVAIGNTTTTSLNMNAVAINANGTTKINDASATNLNTSINTTSGSGTVAIGNAASTVNVTGTTSVTGATNINTAAANTFATNINTGATNTGVVNIANGGGTANVGIGSASTANLNLAGSTIAVAGTTIGVTGTTMNVGVTTTNINAGANSNTTNINTGANTGTVNIGASGVGVNVKGTTDVQGTTTINTTGTANTSIGTTGANASTTTISVGNTGNLTLNNLATATDLNFLTLSGTNSGNVHTRSMSGLADNGVYWNTTSNTFQLGGLANTDVPFTASRFVNLNGNSLTFTTAAGGTTLATLNGATNAVTINATNGTTSVGTGTGNTALGNATGTTAITGSNWSIAATGNALSNGTLDFEGTGTFGPTNAVVLGTSTSNEISATDGTLNTPSSLNVNSGKFTVDATTGNTVAAGGLDVTGTATFGTDTQPTSVRATGFNGGSWTGFGAFGGATSTVVFGESGGKAVIGAHNGTLSAWNDLYVNAGGGSVRVGSTTAPTSTLDVTGSFANTGNANIASAAASTTNIGNVVGFGNVTVGNVGAGTGNITLNSSVTGNIVMNGVDADNTTTSLLTLDGSNNVRAHSLSSLITGSNGVDVTSSGGTSDAHFAGDASTSLFTSNRYINTNASTLNITSGAAPGATFASLNGATNAINLNTTGAGVTSIGTGGTGAVNIGNTTGTTLITGDIKPSVDNTYKNGTAALRWQEVNVGPGSLHLISKAAGPEVGYADHNYSFGVKTTGEFTIGETAGTDRLTLTSAGALTTAAGMNATTGNINAVAGGLQTAGTTRVDNSGNLPNTGDITFTNTADHTISMTQTAAGVAGKNLSISAGSTVSGSAVGGTLSITSGAGGAAGGNSGPLVLSTGTSPSSNSGAVSLTSGAAGSSSGNVTIGTGTSGAGFAAGNVNITPGVSAGGNGAINMTTGGTNRLAVAGTGDVSINTSGTANTSIGNATGTFTVASQNVNITAAPTLDMMTLGDATHQGAVRMYEIPSGTLYTLAPSSGAMEINNNFRVNSGGAADLTIAETGLTRTAADIAINPGAANAVTTNGGITVAGTSALNGAVTLGTTSANAVTLNGTLTGAGAGHSLGTAGTDAGVLAIKGLANTANWELDVTGDARISGTTQINNLNLTGNLMPTVDNTQDIGSAALRWAHVYIGPGSAHFISNNGDAGGYTLGRDFKTGVNTAGSFAISEAVGGADRLALTQGGALTTAQGITASTGDIVTSVGNMNSAGTITAGTGLTVTSGGASITGTTAINTSGAGGTTIGNSGSTTAIVGTTNINTTGNATTTVGSGTSATVVGGTLTANGSVTVSAGNNLTLTNGALNITSGSETITAGNLTLSAGDLSLASGKITASGNISTTGGNISAVGGTLTSGSNTVLGQLILGDGSSAFQGSLRTASPLTLGRTYTLPDASGTISLGGITNGTTSNSTLRWNGTNWAENTNFLSDASGNTQINGTLDAHGVISNTAGTVTITDATAISGGQVDINASSNNSTNINTGTSTGSVSVGNAAAGPIAMRSATTIGLTGTTITQTGNAVVTGTSDLQGNVSNSTGALTVADDFTAAGSAVNQNVNLANIADYGSVTIGNAGANPTGAGSVTINAGSTSGAITLNGTTGVNGATTITGTTGVTGATTINTTGSASTTIGNYNAGTPANSTTTTVAGTVLYSYATSGVASSYTIPQGVTVVEIGNDGTGTGVALTGPAGTNGQVLYVHNNDAQATTGTFAIIPAGQTWSFVYVGGAWQHIQ